MTQQEIRKRFYAAVVSANREIRFAYNALHEVDWEGWDDAEPQTPPVSQAMRASLSETRSKAAFLYDVLGKQMETNMLRKQVQHFTKEQDKGEES